MNAERLDASEREKRLEALLADYLKAAEAGPPPDRGQLLARNPDLAGELADFFAGQDQLEAVASPLRAARPAATNGSHEPSPFPGDVTGTLGDFRILREVGRGGMGVVYEAEQISLGRRVALKVLPFAAALDAKQLQRFKNEAQAAATLQHQNIVPVHYVGCERGVHFYAMQFIEGQTLAAVIAELRRFAGKEKAGSDRSPEPLSEVANALVSGRLPVSARPSTDAQPTTPYTLPPESPAPDTTAKAGLSTERSLTNRAYFRTVARLGEQAAEALEHAHDMGVIHRDIKPGNLLVDGRGNLWITDLGLAHCQSQAGLTMTGDLVGTLRYMSPEQALAKRVVVDHRTDVYSLGATLYELLTLQPAFTGSDRQELLRQIAFEEPPPPRRLNKAIPAELEIIVLKAMEKNPMERYATAREIAEDLRRFLEDKPIRAKRPSLIQRAMKWKQRHKSLVAAASIVLVMAMVAWSVSNFLIWEANQREAAAIKQKEEHQRAAFYALGEAKAEEEHHETTLRKALEVMSQIMAETGELEGADLPETDRVREAILEKALAFYKDFPTRERSSPELIQEVAWAYVCLGNLQAMRSEFAKAKVSYKQACECFRLINVPIPGLQPLPEQLTTDWLKHPKVEQGFRRVLAFWKKESPGDFPTISDYRKEIAENCSRTADFMWRNKLPAKAEKLFNQGIALREALVADYPMDFEFRRSLNSSTR
jgi:serine/threonine protein kinase